VLGGVGWVVALENTFGTDASGVLESCASHLRKGSLDGLSGERPEKPQNSEEMLPATPVIASMSSIDSTPGLPVVASPTRRGPPLPHVSESPSQYFAQ